MIANREIVLIPLGLIVLSFLLELIRKKFLVIHHGIIVGLFWLGVGVLILGVLLKISRWIKDFVREIRS